MTDILLLIAGLGLILAGANYLVEGAGHIARRSGISDFIIGMTVVGIGTSTPEMVVSFISSAKGNADIAVGNVIGSNIFNSLVILGLTALLHPIKLTSNNIRKDIPFGLLASFILCVMGAGKWLNGAAESMIPRTDGILLLCFFAVFMAYTLFSSRQMPEAHAAEEGGGTTKRTSGKLWLNLLMVGGGLAGLIFGGDLFVDAAASLAKKMGVSDTVIALTIMSGGTSLPELASCLVAAYRKRTGLALGNVIGSNVANIFLILGGSAVIHPLSMANIGIPDLVTLLLSSLLMFIAAFTFRKRKLDRPEGMIFVLIYIIFIVILLYK